MIKPQKLQPMRHSIRGLIIKDKKVLLVTGHGADFYWTPGGGREPGETAEEALHREISEELGVRVTSLRPHSTYNYDGQKVDNYLIEIEGTVTPANEITGTAWYSTQADIKASSGFLNTVLPQLLKEGLVE